MIGIVIVSSFILGFLGSYVAKEKNRSGTEGFLLGFLFSFLGVIIVALLPTKEKPKEIVISDEKKEKLKIEQEEWMKNKLLLTIGF
jgi:ABC-type transport system involved in multi-copper enzyme maturation permease subunit